jgi:hypothetical protein
MTRLFPVPWLPYRFPCGRISANAPRLAFVPWLPYRFPCGRIALRQAFVTKAKLAAERLPFS